LAAGAYLAVVLEKIDINKFLTKASQEDILTALALAILYC
jgi:hypothetical protein